MVDLSDVSKKYNAMSDDELVHFASEEGESLTAPAFELLKNEFSSRNLEPSLLTSIENGSHKAEKARLKRLTKTLADEGELSALGIAMNCMQEGKSEADIMYKLMDNGFDEERAQLIIAQVKPEAEVLLAKSRNTMLMAAFACCAGIAMSLISPYRSFVTFLDIVSTRTILFGLIQFIVGLIKFKEYTAVLAQVDKRKTINTATFGRDETLVKEEQ